MNTKVIFIIFIFITALVSSSAFFFFPEAKQAHLELGLAMAFAISLTLLGSAWYFLTGVKTFRPQLKAAYTFLAVGLVLYTLVLLTPAITVFQAVVDLLLKLPSETLNVAIAASFILSSLSMYIGMRTFAKLLNMRPVLSSLPLAFGVAIIATITTAAIMSQTLLRGQALRDQWLSDAIYGSLTWGMVFGLAAAVLAMKVRRVIGTVYKGSMTWMVLALATFVFVLFHELVIKNLFIDSTYVAMQLVLWPYLLNGVLFLGAGLAFHASGRQHVALPANPTYVDVVTGVSQMVSKPEVIDTSLDKVRVITANRGVGGELTAADKATLVETYLSVEQYLTTEEPLRTLTKEGLRNNLPEAFLKDLELRERAAA